MPHESLLTIRHEDYSCTIEEVNTIRDCIEGPNAIKNGPRADVYLPNPADASDNSKESKARYIAYKRRAEYDQFPARTESGYMGALGSTQPDFVAIPTDIEYLIDNSDGNGLSLSESIEITQANLLEVKFHGLLVDFNGLSGFEDDGVAVDRTTAQAEALGLKANIKHYPRESIVDWDWKVVGGVRKLYYAKLAEETSEVDPDSLVRVTTHNQLILRLDEEGRYYQQQLTKTSSGNESLSERKYPEANGRTLDFIPFEVVIDQRKDTNSMPKGFGILYPVCLKALARYQVSADLKESIHRSAQPTMWSSGWDEQSFAMYTEMTGLKQIQTGAGAHIPIPKGSEIGYLDWEADSNAMFKYMEENQKEAKALGARFDTSDPKDEAVGTAKLRSAEELSALVNIQESVTESYTRLLTWANMFMSSNESPEIEIVLNKEFNKIKLTPQERKSIIDEFTGGIIDKREALEQLSNGGVLVSDAEELIQRADLTGE